MDMKSYGLYESASVKVRPRPTTEITTIQQLMLSQIQILKTAVEAARVLLRVDDVVQATRKERDGGGGGAPPEEMMAE